MILVKNVINSITNEFGELSLVGYKYTDIASKERNSENVGLVVHFGNRYIGSVIMTQNEYNLIVNYGSNIVKDLGYILSFSPTSLSFYNLASFFTNYEIHENGCGTSTLSTFSFDLVYSVDVLKNYTRSFGVGGLQLALIEALKDLKESDCIVGRELHTPTKIFDFTRPTLNFKELIRMIAQYENSISGADGGFDPEYSIKHLTVDECFKGTEDKCWNDYVDYKTLEDIREKYPTWVYRGNLYE